MAFQPLDNPNAGAVSSDQLAKAGQEITTFVPLRPMASAGVESVPELLRSGRTNTSSMPLAFGFRFFAYCFAVEVFQWSATPAPALAALLM